MKQFVVYGAYPFVLVVCILMHYLLLENHVGFLGATYLPILIGAILVGGLELTVPYRVQWWPEKGDCLQDILYMVLIQGLLPKLFSVFILLAFLKEMPAEHWSIQGWWPKGFPVPLQMLLMMVLADGLRYWLHRWAHEWEPLWRFHAVHHSPQKLYWLNVGRFHPIDKGLQLTLDTFPFLLLGVGKDVLALYIVCYAINGFFQHSNVNVRLGPLNYIISGPELHRWHHSMVKEESNHNYGNNLILWDMVFHTWYWPTDREVRELGLGNRQYPTAFIEQMTAPFIPGVDKQTAQL